MAEARYLRSIHGEDVQIVYAGVVPPPDGSRAEIDASVTFGELEELFRVRGVIFTRSRWCSPGSPRSGGGTLSVAGGMPMGLLAERPRRTRFRKLRGLKALKAMSRAVMVDKIDHGLRGHPVERGLARPPALGAQGRALLAPGGGAKHRAAPEPAAGGGARSGCKCWRGVRSQAPASGRRWRGGATGIEDDRTRTQRQARGTAGPAVTRPAGRSRRRRRWAGRVSGSARRFRSGRRRSRSGRRPPTC